MEIKSCSNKIYNPLWQMWDKIIAKEKKRTGANSAKLGVFS
jgi:hypothetical protein